jgi:branched-chain amino acid transport system substrate-binding protein
MLAIVTGRAAALGERRHRRGSHMISRTQFFRLLAAATALAIAPGPAAAQETVKIGFSVPLTGAFSENGKQMVAAIKIFTEQRGSVVAGRKIEVIVRDDGGVADQAKRIAQEFVVQSKVAVLAGYNPTPVALAVAPLSAEAKIPQIVVGSSASVTTTRSPYIVRTFSTQAQITVPMADWMLKNGIKRVVTFVSDYAPGLETEKAFIEAFKAGGGEIVESVRVPLQALDFSPFLQRARDARPEAIFAWVPGGLAGSFVRQYAERGLQSSGIRLIGTGDITDDDILNQLGEPMLGITTALQYSAAHESEKNKAFVAGFERVGGGMRPDHVGVAVYDAMHLIYAALEKTGGNADGDALLAAMKGMAWESPRGPIAIDPETRDIVQDIYIRRVERRNGQLYNIEFDKYPAVKDPFKASRSK